MTAINFISNLPRGLRSGGFSAMNAAAFHALECHADVHFGDPISPPVNRPRQLLSRVLRELGVRGRFEFFSHARLSRTAAEAAAALGRPADLDFFHGFTPWVATRPLRPYAAWSDCTFRDYVEIYHPHGKFLRSDLDRIEAAEGVWLRSARGVAFTSKWAADRATSQYGLDPNRVAVVGIFGETELPQFDEFAGGDGFAFISTDFAAKGGAVVLEAFRRVRADHPEVTLTIVGDSPKRIEQTGVQRTGFLRKECTEDNERFRAIIARSRAVVHPTISDIAPLLAVEAAYFGCPVIASDRFAIPEIIEHGRTGLLLGDPTNCDQVAAAMTQMLQDETAYCAMRRAAWDKARRDHLRVHFEHRLWAFVEQAMARP